MTEKLKQWKNVFGEEKTEQGKVFIIRKVIKDADPFIMCGLVHHRDKRDWLCDINNNRFIAAEKFPVDLTETDKYEIYTYEQVAEILKQLGLVDDNNILDEKAVEEEYYRDYSNKEYKPHNETSSHIASLMEHSEKLVKTESETLREFECCCGGGEWCGIKIIREKIKNK